MGVRRQENEGEKLIGTLKQLAGRSGDLTDVPHQDRPRIWRSLSE